MQNDVCRLESHGVEHRLQTDSSHGGCRTDAVTSFRQQGRRYMPSNVASEHSCTQKHPQAQNCTDTERISDSGQDFDRRLQPADMHEGAAPEVTSYQGAGTGGENLQSSPLDIFVCAICRRIMVDPVVTASGQTYDRVCFCEWVEMGNTTCPLTGFPLSQFDFIPNGALKHIISSMQNPGGSILHDGAFLVGCPHDLLCALCRRIMEDPVVVASGQTYDRDCFHDWLNAGNNLCPLTGKALSHYEYIPNLGLKDLISAWWDAFPFAYDFLCGICNRVMTNPVVIFTGQTYDKTCFHAWLDAGKSFCPITGETLSCFGYFPNLALEYLITMWGNTSGSLFTGNDAFVPPPPRYLVCGICERIMEDPVVVSSGQTYDKVCFQRWLNEGNTQCPITNEPLSDYSCIPNLALKDQISLWWSTTPPPQSFVCALCNRILEHPVVVASGYTYDRACFKAWLGAGNTQCPILCQSLSHHMYIRNRAFKNLISSWWNASEPYPSLGRSPVVYASSEPHSPAPDTKDLHRKSASASSTTILTGDSPKHTHQHSTFTNPIVSIRQKDSQESQLLSGSSENISSFFNDSTSYAESSHSYNLSLAQYSCWSDAAGLDDSLSESLQTTEKKDVSGSQKLNSYGEVYEKERNGLAVEDGVNESAQKQGTQADSDIYKIQTSVSLLPSEKVHEQRASAAQLKSLSRDKDEDRVLIAKTGALKPLLASENINSFVNDSTSYAESSHCYNMSSAQYSCCSDATDLDDSLSELLQTTEKKDMSGSQKLNSYGEVYEKERNGLAVEDGVNESAQKQGTQADSDIYKIQTSVSLLPSEKVHEQRDSAAQLKSLSRDKDEDRVLIAKTGALKPLLASENINSFVNDSTSYAESSHCYNMSSAQYSCCSDATDLDDSLSELLQTTVEKDMSGSQKLNSYGADYEQGWNGLAVQDGVNESAQEQETQADSDISKIQTLVSLLLSEKVHEQRDSAAQLRALSRDKDEDRVLIAKTGALKPLVALLQSKDVFTQLLATTTLLNLSLNQEIKIRMIEEHAITHLVRVVKEGLSPKARGNAALALASISHDDEENKIKIGLAGAIPPLIDLLANGPERGQKDAAAVLYRLSTVDDNKLKMVRAGIVRILLNFLSDKEDNYGMIEKTMAMMRNLVSIEAGRVAIVEEGGMISILSIMRVGSAVIKAMGVTILVQVCKHSARHRDIVRKAEPVSVLKPLQHTASPERKAEIDELLELLMDPK